MNTEEKAKAYDEAIQRAGQFMETPYLENSDDVVGYIFPELKESEDERIRKELIEFVKSRGGFKQEYIAWLEKQGEQKPVEWSEEDERLFEDIEEAISKSTWGEYDKKLHISFLKHLRPQPKQEWSEEDEYQYNTIFHTLNMRKYVHEKKGDEEEAKRYEVLSNWFKSLKDRVLPQPKQDRNVSDYSCWETVVAAFSECAGKSVSKDEWLRCNDWLYSVHPMKQWKPTGRGGSNYIVVKR